MAERDYMETIRETRLIPKKRKITKEEVKKVPVYFSKDNSRNPCAGFLGKIDNNVKINLSTCSISSHTIDNIKF